ncbi:MAG TPA: metal-dependent hydrolase [Kiritimatiellia bacterium]|nr:metal-dependent hydrolase [Kiritimatiellia bacterium]
MPSPLAHSLAGVALTTLWWMPAKPAWRERWEAAWSLRGWFLLGIVVANLPDLDYLPGIFTGELNAYHQLHTHSIGWWAVTTLGLGFVVHALHPELGWKPMVWLGLVQGSHLAMDWMTEDRGVPPGFQALWPFSDRVVHSPVSVFKSFDKADWGELFQVGNLVPLAWEAAIMGAVVAGALAWSQRTARRPGIGLDGSSGRR